MKARLITPSGNFTGNLLWRESELAGKEDLLEHSLAAIREVGYWASPYPEGDGVTFKPTSGVPSPDQMVSDFQASFPWLVISLGTTGSANLELAALEADAQTPSMTACTAIVPVLKLHFEESFDLGPFRLVCAEDFDPKPQERLADWKGSYLQFEIELPYAVVLCMNRHVDDDDVAILQCLAMAEHALDLIRFEYCSFRRPQFTPNPAGQLENGMYAVEIIPRGRNPLKPVNLKGISRPMSASNNWLGPQIEDRIFRGRPYLEEVLHGRSDELALAVKSALRLIRQAFYAHGEESRFLTLVFALDGLAHPDKKWTGLKHHAYIAALTSHGSIARFKTDLHRYSELYALRNELVHKGKDFYELSHRPTECCDDMFSYLKRLVLLMEDKDLQTVSALKALAKEWLDSPPFASHLTAEIDKAISQAQ